MRGMSEGRGSKISKCNMPMAHKLYGRKNKPFRGKPVTRPIRQGVHSRQRPAWERQRSMRGPIAFKHEAPGAGEWK